MDQNAPEKFTKDFTRQEPLSDDAIEQALAILKSGRLHRYNVAQDQAGETALLEKEYAAYQGAKYCLACASCGMAMFLALKSAGVQRGDKVLCNAFTLAPVPGAIHHAGAQIVLVEIEDDYTVDLDDLEQKAASEDVKWFLISHMRGHLTDMDRLVEICEKHGLTLIEDCAHTMGASWDGKKSGSFGKVACFSTQTYKHMNSGEGGLLTTDDPDLIARAIIHSGSYMLYDRHLARPDLSWFDPVKKITPNYSCRMDNLRAALLRVQLRNLDSQRERWNKRYHLLEELINSNSFLQCPRRPAQEEYVGSSIQFSVRAGSPDTIKLFLQRTLTRGVELKWFGNPEPLGFTSAYTSWEYLDEIPRLSATNSVLATMCDMRIPLTFTLDDCRHIGQILCYTADEIFTGR